MGILKRELWLREQLWNTWQESYSAVTNAENAADSLSQLCGQNPTGPGIRERRWHG